MTSSAAVVDLSALSDLSASNSHAVAAEARRGLTSPRKNLAPWLFYDEAGSQLFEQITELPEYYLSRTERALFTAYADSIFREFGLTSATAPPREAVSEAARPAKAPIPFARPLAVLELGAGTASKTGILLRALTRLQPSVLYQPVDISSSALDQARTQLEAAIPGLTVCPHTANYVTHRFPLTRAPHARVLALYIGSSIGNFSPSEARAVLRRLRGQLSPGDALLLGVDLAPCLPGATPQKSVETLVAAYDDSAGVTAAFNRNVLVRLNRELGTDFDPDRFAHRALWNPMHCRMEMHLVSLAAQTVLLPRSSAGHALTVRFAPNETIHTENSYKFTPAALASLLGGARFTPKRTFNDPDNLFSVTLACAD